MKKAKFILMTAAALSLCMMVTSGCSDKKEKAQIAHQSPFERIKAEAEKGDVKAQYDLGICYFYGLETAKDINQAIIWWERAAAGNHAPAYYQLGACYEEGTGVIKNQYYALYCYRQAARMGSDHGQCAVGRCYTDGIGTMPILSTAVIEYLPAALNGNAEAQYNVGKFFAEGKYYPKNFALASFWYRESAQKSYRKAQEELPKLKLEL